MNVDRLYRLTCGVQHYAWGDPGAPGQLPLIAALLGVPADGRPFAELWIGAHPALPATVADWPGAPRLDALLAAHPEPFLGPDGAAARALPFLLKVLSCVQPLSIQAHPDRDLAARLHAKDPRSYPDANHKPEIAVALTRFEALAGFRPAADIVADTSPIPALQRFLAPVPAGPDWLRLAYARCFTADREITGVALDETRAWLAGRRDLADHERLFLLCSELHAGDPGAISVFFLNHLWLEPGEAVYIGPNVPHAYVRGCIVECMAASDNVVRAGLTRRPVDREVLLQMLSYHPEPPAVQRGTAVAPGVRRYRVPAPEFELEFRDVTAPAEVPSEARVSLLLVLDGEMDLATPGWELTARRGTALLWPAAVPTVRVARRSATARWVRAFPAGPAPRL